MVMVKRKLNGVAAGLNFKRDVAKMKNIETVLGFQIFELNKH